MIRSFACKDTEQVWQGRASRKFPREIQDRALRKLRQIAAARAHWMISVFRRATGSSGCAGTVRDSGSIRINEQWRICFAWNNGDAIGLDIVAYH